jgi:hypothetical protein
LQQKRHLPLLFIGFNAINFNNKKDYFLLKIIAINTHQTRAGGWFTGQAGASAGGQRTMLAF